MNADLADMFVALRDKYPDAREREVLDTWDTPLAGASASGTLRTWMQGRDGQRVDTFQYDRGAGSVWVPGERTLDSGSHSTFFELDGSARYYEGMRVLATTSTMIAAGDDRHICIYRVQKA